MLELVIKRLKFVDHVNVEYTDRQLNRTLNEWLYRQTDYKRRYDVPPQRYREKKAFFWQFVLTVQKTIFCVIFWMP